MTRAQLITQMGNAEFVMWSRYFDRIEQARELAEKGG